MDIPALSMAMSTAKLAQEVSVGMMKKAIDQTEQTGQQIAEMIEATAVSPEYTVDIKL